MSLDGMLLTAAVCASRTAHDELKRIGVDVGNLPEAAGVVLRAASEQYRRDPNATSVDRDILRSQIQRRYGENEMANSVMDFVASFPEDVSAVNVAEEYRLLRLENVARSAATMLATGQHGDETRALLDKYSDLRNGSTEEAVESWRLTIEDFEDDNSVRIPIAPQSLNNYIGGGVLRGHNITVYGRPDSGKSMFALNCAAALVRAGHRVLYVANEEPARDITLRLLARLCDIDVGELRDHDTLAQALEYCAPQYAGWHLLHRAGITIDGIRAAADKIKPDVIVVDQLKNIAVNDDNRALQLDKLARQVRELGIEFDAVTISVTQAGESAHNRLVLGLGDVEWSNTGIPGAADLMIGIGVDDLYDSEGKRMISLPKNKVNGKHGAFPVWVNPKRTAFMSKREG